MDFDLDEIAADATLQLLHTGRAVHTAPACKLDLHSLHAGRYEGDTLCVCLNASGKSGLCRGRFWPEFWVCRLRH
jgi:hypothetical protein